MNVKKKKYIIMLKDESAYERIFGKDGYLTNDIEYAWTCNNEDYAKEVLNGEVDEPSEFEIVPLEIDYKFKTM